MQIGRMKTSHPSHTGQILVAAGIINHIQLEEAVAMTKKLRMPIGRVLMMAGHINQRNLDSALMAQAMVRSDKLHLESAVHFLGEASRTCLPLEDILAKHGWRENSPTLISELGDFLVTATIISRTDLGLAIRELGPEGGSLTRYLIDNKIIRTFDAMNALRALAAFKQEGLSYDQAVSALKTAVSSGMTFDQSLRKVDSELAIPKTSMKFGELLSTAGLLSDVDLIHALEIALTNDAMLGEVLVETEIITRHFLHCLLDIQEMLEQRQINPYQARELIQRVHEGKKNVQQCMIEQEQFTMGVLELLKQAEFVTDKEIELATSHSDAQAVDVPEMLFDSGYIDRTALDIARRCQRMVCEQFIPIEQAVQVLAAYKMPAGVEHDMEITQVNEVVDVRPTAD